MSGFSLLAVLMWRGDDTCGFVITVSN
jgi:hypothetical protein